MLELIVAGSSNIEYKMHIQIFYRCGGKVKILPDPVLLGHFWADT